MPDPTTIPPPPKGYTLDATQAVPPPPPGYTLDAASAKPWYQESPRATMSAAPGGVKGWLSDLEGDVRYGSDNTLPGKVLKKMGAPGINQGVAPGVADYMGSPILGTVHAAQGVAETPEHPIMGPIHTVGGVLEAATIPASFVAPEAGRAAASAVDKVAGMIPSTTTAGAKFKAVMDAAKDVPVSLDNAQEGILRLMDWQKKTQLGPTINKFLNRVTNPKMGDMTYGEARDFYQLMGKLSSDELSKIPPGVRYDLTRAVTGLKADIGNTAEVVGKGQQYYDAMSEFKNAKKLEDLSDTTKEIIFEALKRSVPYGVGTGIGAYAVKKYLEK